MRFLAIVATAAVFALMGTCPASAQSAGSGQDYQILTEDGIKYRVPIEARTPAQIKAERREQDAYEDARHHRLEMAEIEREAERRFRQEHFRYNGRYYSYNPGAYDRSSGSYAARIQAFGPCASKLAANYSACR